MQVLHPLFEQVGSVVLSEATDVGNITSAKKNITNHVLELFVQLINSELPSDGLLMQTIDKLLGATELHFSGVLLSVQVLKNLQGVSVVGLQGINLISDQLQLSLFALEIGIGNVKLGLGLFQLSFLWLDNLLDLCVFVHGNAPHANGLTSHGLLGNGLGFEVRILSKLLELLVQTRRNLVLIIFLKSF